SSLVTFKTLTVSGYFKKPYTGKPELLVKHLSAGSSARFPLALSLENRVFSAQVELKEGVNDMVLGSGVLSILCLPTSTASAEGKYLRQMIHPSAQKNCGDCHSIWEGELALTDEFPGLCARCHGAIGAAPKGSPAFVQNEHTRKTTKFCIGCHQPHSSENQFLLKKDPLTTCTRCHETLKEGAGHSGKGQRQCSTCHSPHGSPNPRMLLKPTAVELCIDCHKGESKWVSGNKSSHKPAMNGQCLACHIPHSKGSPNLLAAPADQLCQKCHAQVRLKLHEEKMGGCSGCHAAHQSTLDKLIKKGTSKDCEGCHQDKAGSKGHVGEGGECVSCHNPHKYTSEISSGACAGCHVMAAADIQN
ncbi:hypothetical protein FDZ71_15595, partial [bacterium]